MTPRRPVWLPHDGSRPHRRDQASAAAEQSRVIQFAFELARERQLSGNKLSELAQRMADSNDPVEAQKLREEIHRGFYGE